MIAWRWLALLIAALVLVAAPGDAAAQRSRRRRARRGVAVEIVDVSGGRAYVRPGQSAGVVRGSEIVIGRSRHRIVASSREWAAFDLRANDAIEIGARGTARTSVNPGEESQPERLDPPRALAAFHGQWPDAVLPSSQQSPAPVPLGRTGGERRVDLIASAGVSALLPARDGDALVRGDARVRVQVAPFDGLPLWLAGDVAGQLWAASDLDDRAFTRSRPPIRVRELSVAWGRAHDPGEFYAAVGRLRYAAMQLGMLDGIALRSPALEGLTVGAFGGFVPRPDDGVPDVETQRFGVELAYRDPSSELRPSIGVVAHGSMFRGTPDERRLNAVAQIFPDIGRLGAHVELSLHDPDNPWAVDALELSAAGIDGGIRLGDVDLGARFDVRRPERSLWLASFLPASWLCIPVPQPADAGGTEPCSGTDDARVSGSADIGLRVDRWALRAGGHVVHYVSDPTLGQVGGYASVRTPSLFDAVRADLLLSGSTGLLSDTLAARVSVGWAIVPELLDVSAHYRIGYGIYRADFEGWVEHMVGATVWLTPMPELSITASGDGITGRDLDVVMLQMQLVLRPTF